MEKQKENKKDGYAGWRRFRNRFNTVLIIIALITLYCSFYFVGPIRGKVVDAKTGKPLAGIEVEYIIDGSELCIFFAHSCPGWDKRVQTHTDNNGKFKIPFSIAKKIPFIQWLESERRISANGTYTADNKSYDNYKEEFVWFPFRSFKFALVPVPETLDDCRDNLTEDEQYRCVEMLARRDAMEVNKLSDNKIYDNYLDSKYLNDLTNYCEYSNYLDNDCRAILAVNKKNKDVCLDKDLCLFFSAIDLRDKSWCEKLPIVKDPYMAISRENCEYVIDTLTVNKK